MTAPAPSPPILSRHADSVLWLARYMERIENLARLLDVARNFAHDELRSWEAILRINGDEAEFRAGGQIPSGTQVARFYLLDRGPTSIVAAIDQVRENARIVRALISTEMWAQINHFHAQLIAVREDDIAPQNLSSICAMLKDGVQAHTGITEGTFYRDQSWSFYQAGRHLERADQITRLVDIKYAALPAPGVPAKADAVWWDTLLRAAAGYHAYRRVSPHGYSPQDVAGFLLLDPAFPRSLGGNLRHLHEHLDRLRATYDVATDVAMERLDRLMLTLPDGTRQALRRGDLPAYLDTVQAELGLLQNDITFAANPAEAGSRS